MPYGFSDIEWARGKAEMTKILRQTARLRGMFTYTDLSNAAQTIRIEPHEAAMSAMLGQISTYESRSGRGMLSVIVVHKYGDMEPGNGFYSTSAQQISVLTLPTAWRFGSANCTGCTGTGAIPARKYAVHVGDQC